MKVLISGYYGFGNVGDEAVLEAIIQGIRQHLPRATITVLSSHPGLTAEFNQVSSIHRYNIWEIVKAMRTADIFISGGGSLFQDVTSSHSFWYYIGLVKLAKLFGKKVVVMAQGFGPLNKMFNRFVARLILNKVDLITLRDDDSRCEIERLGVSKPKIAVTADPTLILGGMDKNRGRKLLALEGIPMHKPLVGIAVRSLPQNGSRADRLFQALAERLDQLAAKHGFVPVFLLFQCPGDIRETKRVIKEMSAQSHIVYKMCRPGEMLSLFSHFSLFIGLRLHSLIFAAIEALPMVGISYDPKIISFMRSVGQPCVELDRLDQLENIINGVLADSDKIRNGLRSQKSSLYAKAEQSFNLLAQI